MTSAFAQGVSAVVSDVDGTLVTHDKVLTPRARSAVAELGAAGIAFSIISSRPPRGLRMLIEPLGLTRPMAGFNGGVLVDSQLSASREHLLPASVAQRAIDFIAERRADAWLFTVQDWLLRDSQAPYVALEERTVKFPPRVVPDFTGSIDRAAKIVAVSEDFALLKSLAAEARTAFAGWASVALSQPYYLDFTHPRANKGAALLELSELLSVPPARIAVIGDAENDVAMFRQGGLSIAMGNASAEVQSAADLVTGSNAEDGFANAVARFILPAAGRASAQPR
jgi:Cof subfamily protein (haloacid dehalogenase superfamily)